jgi:hypothetical protein
MKKIVLFSLILVMIAALAFNIFSASAAYNDMVRVTIINRTKGLVYVSLLPKENATVVYFLDVLPGETEVFTVPQGRYTHTTYACGKTVYGAIDLGSQITLAFTPCGSEPANSGERGIEKVFLDTYPFRSDFQFEIK